MVNFMDRQGYRLNLHSCHDPKFFDCIRDVGCSLCNKFHKVRHDTIFTIATRLGEAFRTSGESLPDGKC